jgi:hypothetical protein
MNAITRIAQNCSYNKTAIKNLNMKINTNLKKPIILKRNTRRIFSTVTDLYSEKVPTYLKTEFLPSNIIFC